MRETDRNSAESICNCTSLWTIKTSSQNYEDQTDNEEHKTPFIYKNLAIFSDNKLRSERIF